MKYSKQFATLLLCTILPSCISFSAAERERLSELHKAGIDSRRAVAAKSPGKAAALALLPGGGLYVAGKVNRPSGRQEDTVAAVSLANWALWPASVLWAVPQSYIDAQSVNRKEALYRYRGSGTFE